MADEIELAFTVETLRHNFSALVCVERACCRNQITKDRTRPQSHEPGFIVTQQFCAGVYAEDYARELSKVTVPDSRE
jgi:hypothetical protein